MNVILTKKITLKSAIVYLKLQRKIKREDIQNYLQGKHFDNPIVENRVREYLKSVGIYNEQYNLTTPGYEAKDKGMVKEKEEGKYQIWFTQDDLLFGNRIFYFTRMKPESYNNNQQPELEKINLNLSGKNFCSLPIEGEHAQDSVEFSIIDEISTVEKKMTSEISFNWTWNDTQSSLFKFSGNFEKVSIDKNKPVDFQINLEQHIPTIIPGWNDKTQRWPIKIEDVKDKDTYQYFKYSRKQPRDGYVTCEFIKLPVEPYNPEEAVQWRDKIISTELEKKYIHPDDFEGIVNTINQNEGFKAYYDQLDHDVPDMNHYIEKLEPGKKSDRGPAYWHLAAPMDLIVGIPKSLNIDSFSLSKGEDISFEGLTAKFGTVRAEKIFYYDKYVYNKYQQRSVSTFLSCFGVSNLDICIITDTQKPYYNDYFIKNKPDITVTDISSVYPKTSDEPHDRFIVFKSGDELIIWTSTNSIDFIRFNIQGEIQPDTSGAIQKSVTFTKVKPDVLGTQLEQFIKGINK